MSSKAETALDRLESAASYGGETGAENFVSVRRVDAEVVCAALRAAMKPVRIEPPEKPPKVHPSRDHWWQRRRERDSFDRIHRWDQHWFAGRDAASRRIKGRIRAELAKAEEPSA